MDSSQRGRMPSAKDLTAEIDRATDVAMGVGLGEGQNTADNGLDRELRGADSESAQVLGMTSERAQALGRGALFSRPENEVLTDGGYETPEEVAFGRIDNTGEASVESAVELSEVIGNVTDPETMVGMVSKVEEEEFERRDTETAANELNPERSREAEIEYRNQEAVAKGVAPEVEAFLHKRNPELSDLMSLYRKGRNKTLGIVNHPIGRDN